MIVIFTAVFSTAFVYSFSSMAGDAETVAATKHRLNALLAKLPPTGDFDLSNVLKSVYFFS